MGLQPGSIFAAWAEPGCNLRICSLARGFSARLQPSAARLQPGLQPGAACLSAACSLARIFAAWLARAEPGCKFGPRLQKAEPGCKKFAAWLQKQSQAALQPGCTTRVVVGQRAEPARRCARVQPRGPTRPVAAVTATLGALSAAAAALKAAATTPAARRAKVEAAATAKPRKKKKKK